MQIKILQENTALDDRFQAEHGLSVYMKTNNHALLIDTGQSVLTWENAKTLQVDLSQIDTVFLSHGHYDHTGGLLSFVEQNSIAQIYLNEYATGKFYNLTDNRYIGMDPKILQLKQLHFMGDKFVIDEELSGFSHVTGRKLWPQGNKVLGEKIGAEFVQDEFFHEQYVVIQTEGKKILCSGCAHNGILNILEKFQEIYGCSPDYVISGFHMRKKQEHNVEERQLIENVAKELCNYKTIFYTGHCTGIPAFEQMREIMREQLQPIRCGEEFSL